MLTRVFSHNARGALGNRASKKTGKKTCYPGDMAMRKTTSRLREPHTFFRPDFAKVHLIWEFFLNRTLSGPPVNAESTFSRPPLTTGKCLEKVYLLVFCNGLEKVLSVLTGGPDKVRFKKNSQIRCTLAKSGLEKVCGSRRREGVFCVCHISPVNLFLSVFLRPGCRGPPPSVV